MPPKVLAAREVLKRLDGRSPEEIESDRIARRVLRSVARHKPDWQVRGGLFNVSRTTHTPEVYATAAALLGDMGVDMEVHRLNEHFTRVWVGPGGSGVHIWDEPVDRVVVKSVGGQPVPRERIPQTERNHLERIHPPEIDYSASLLTSG